MFSGAVLTGGRSTRMGRDKALIEVDGRALACIAADALVTAGADEVFAVGGDAHALETLGLRVVPDGWPGEGPLGGLVTALGTAAHDTVVVLACDLPGVTAEAVRALIGALAEHDGAVPVVAGRAQHLVAAWRRDQALAPLRAAFADGERAIWRACDALRVAPVTLREFSWTRDADERERVVSRRARGVGTRQSHPVEPSATPANEEMAAMRHAAGNLMGAFDRAAIEEKHREFSDSRDPRLRDELVQAHLGLARQVARRFTNRGEALDDLVQVATMALLKALDRYDPARGVKFSTYATSSMTGELKRYFRDHAWVIRVPRSLQELHLETNEAVETLRQRLGRSPTIPEIAEYVGEPDEEVLLAIEAGRAYRVHSLDAPAPGEDRGIELGDDDPDFDGADGRHDLSPLLAQLPRRERRILHLRFSEGLTQSDIADRVGLSQMHVSRLLSRSLAELRLLAEADGGPSVDVR